MRMNRPTAGIRKNSSDQAERPVSCRRRTRSVNVGMNRTRMIGVLSAVPSVIVEIRLAVSHHHQNSARVERPPSSAKRSTPLRIASL